MDEKPRTILRGQDSWEAQSYTLEGPDVVENGITAAKISMSACDDSVVRSRSPTLPTPSLSINPIRGSIAFFNSRGPQFIAMVLVTVATYL